MQDEEDLDMSKTYYFENNEYVLTGRVAKRTIKNETKRTTRRRSNQPQEPEEFIEMMVEISPVTELRAPGGFSDCQWVKPSDLFVIKNRLHDYEEDDDEDYDDDDDDLDQVINDLNIEEDK